jgi:hypothetical protein
MSTNTYSPTTGAEASPEAQRGFIYEWLSREFRRVEESLDVEGKTYLDGKLWQIADQLQKSGMKGGLDGWERARESSPSRERETLPNGMSVLRNASE